MHTQQSPSSLLACHQWLTSADANLQFLACQTLLINARDNWHSATLQQLRSQLAALLNWLLLGNNNGLDHSAAPPVRLVRPVRKKLIQAFVYFIINSYPEQDLLQVCLQAKAIDVLGEIPAELDRLPSLSSAQYSFKDHLGETVPHLIPLLLDTFAIPEHLISADPSTTLDALQCFAAWLSLKNCRLEAQTRLIPCLLDRLASATIDEQVRAAIVETMIGWLESGVEELALERLLPRFNRLLPLLQSLFAQGTEAAREELVSLSKMIRLYADLIVPVLAHSEGAGEFIELVKSLTAIETHLSAAPTAEISLFWPSFWEDNLVESLLPLVRSTCEQVITALVSNLLHLAPPRRLDGREDSISEYRQAVMPLFVAACRVHATWARHLLLHLIDSKVPPQREIGLHIIASVAEAINMEDPSWQDLLVPLTTIRPAEDAHSPAFFAAVRATAGLIKPTIHLETVSPFLLQLLRPGAVNAALPILQAIAALQSPPVNRLILQDFEPIWNGLGGGEARIEYWRLLCRAIDEQAETPLEPLLRLFGGSLLGARQQGREPPPEAVLMLAISVREVQRLELSTIHGLLQAATVNTASPQDAGLVAAWNELWVEVIQRYGGAHPDPILQLLRPSITLLLAATRRDNLLLQILEAAIVIIVPTEATLAIAEQISASLLQPPSSTEGEEEEHWVSLLPLLNKAIKHAAPRVLLPTLLAPVGGVLRMFAGGSSFSDALLRPTCKYLELICEFASSQLSTQDRATIFEGVLSAALNRLLESQLEIVAPLLLALLQADPLELGRRLQSRLTASPALQEIGKKMVACRTPRLFARLLLQLVQNLPSNPPC